MSRGRVRLDLGNNGDRPDFQEGIRIGQMRDADRGAYIAVFGIGNLAENERSFLFLMDYTEARRLKLWGRARIVDEPALLARLAAELAYPAHIEQAIIVIVLAWDWNCSQHIPQLVPAERT